jgi:hypothetical protein
VVGLREADREKVPVTPNRDDIENKYDGVGDGDFETVGVGDIERVGVGDTERVAVGDLEIVGEGDMLGDGWHK